MKKLLFLSILTTALSVVGGVTQGVSAADNPLRTVGCESFGLPTTDQCFTSDAVYLKQGLSSVGDMITNTETTPIFVFQNDPWNELPGVTTTSQALQGSTWAVPFFEHIKEATDWREFTRNGKTYYAREIAGGATSQLLRSTSGGYLVFSSVPNSADPKKPLLQITFTTTAFASKLSNGITIPDKTVTKTHKEHAFFYGAWCGDGIVQTQFGEKYDDGANNGKPGYASTDCQTKVPPTPTPVAGVCDGASIGKVTTTAPKNLCSTGTPGVVTETASGFTWSCGGIDGGATASCMAPKPAPEVPTINPGVCDQTFNKKIRVGYGYRFPDTITNNNTYPFTLNSFKVNFKENYGDDMNGDGKFTYDNFVWKAPFTAGATLPVGAKDVEFIEANPSYQLLKAPAKRQKDNIYIEYLVNRTGNGQTGNHLECISYEVTWCGDGIVDTDEGEKCDPNDPNKTNWGPGGCDVMTCQPVDSTPKLAIKKYAKGVDAQTAGQQVSVMPGEEYPYTFEVTNTSNVAAVGAKVVDIFPDAITVVKTGTGTGWTCEQSGQTMTCRYSQTIKPGEKAPTITAIATLKDTVKTGDSIRNVAGVCELDPKKPINDPSCVINRDECKPGDVNYNPDTKSCDPSTVTVGGPSVTIKKYAKEITVVGDSQTAPVQLAAGEAFNYYYVFKNTSNTPAKNVIVKDTFPENINWNGDIKVTNPQGQDVTSDWNITKTTYNNTSRIAVVATKKTPLEANSGEYRFTVPVKLAPNLAANTNMQNVVYICAEDMTTNPKGPNGEDICGNTNPPPPPPTGQCTDTPPGQQKDPACIVIGGLDLSIKKYVDSNDAQPGSPVSKNTNDTFNYVLRVKVESGTSTGATTVKDILPAGIELNGTATGSGWTISWNGKTMTATSTQVVTTGNYFADITIPVKLTAGAGQTIRNDATVQNPNEKPNSCYTDNRMPNGNEQSCEKDPKNTDPAIVKTPTPPTTTGPGGPGGGGGGGGGGYCGDGVLTQNEKNQGMTCDLGTNNGKPVTFTKNGVTQTAVLCDLSCKTPSGVVGTNPAENAIKFNITIPGFSRASAFGHDSTKTLSFKENGMIVGLGSNVFALADELKLDINSDLKMGLTLDSNVKFQIKSSNSSAVAGQSVEKPIAQINNGNLPQFTVQAPGEAHPRTYYVVARANEPFFIPANSTFTDNRIQCPGNTVGQDCVLTVDTSSNIIYNGSELQSFKGIAKGSSEIGLYNKDADLAAFKVEVTDSKVSTAGSSVNRKIEEFTNNIPNVIASLKANTTANATANTNSTASNLQSTTINANIRNTGNVTVKNLSELSSYTHNGNPNVYGIKGNLTITGCADNNTFNMAGVKTVLVEGNITFECNTSYGSDTNASWAFIAKGGNIVVKESVTNLSGVFVALKEGTNGGLINGGNATANILRIDGTVYGNAKPLFDTRTYARGSNAYDILTTGTVLTYSNRALRNPPPLLSNYLNAYQVQRVVR